MAKLSYNLIILSLSTFLFEVFPYLIFGFGRTLPSPWNSWPDILDMILWMPLTIFIFINIYEYLIKNLSLNIRFLYFAGSILFVWGHGVHWAANSLDVAPCNTPPAYYLDEIFGHSTLFLGFLIVLVILALLSPVVVEDIRGGMVSIASSALLFAFSSGSMALEGQVVGMFLTAAVIITIYLLYLLFTYHSLSSPSAKFFLIWGISLLILLGGYYTIMGGFIQPSEWINQ